LRIPQLSPQESLPVFQAIWIATVNFRPPSISVGLLPIVRRDLRHACQVNRVFAWTISALDYRRMVRLPGLADDFVPEFRFRASSDSVLAEPSLSVAAFFPDLREDCVRLTFAKPALTYVVRWFATWLP
jgi:hypothetical protein